jgi:hypothetical protein
MENPAFSTSGRVQLEKIPGGHAKLSDISVIVKL